MIDAPSPTACPAVSNRARGAIAARFRRVGARSEIVGPFETGGYRLRLPRARDAACDAVIVNTGGGMAGGDRASFRFATAAGAHASITTTAAEKIYRADGEATRVDVALTLAEGSILEWLPQETILFERARLARTLTVDMAPDAALLAGEMLVFGRIAMGETLRSASLHDRWRIRRDGRLALAEDLRLDGDIAALLDRPALGAGARASATLVLLAPSAETHLDAVRDALGAHRDAVSAGSSAFDGRLVVRGLSRSPAHLRMAVAAVLLVLRGRPPSRLWG